MGEGEDVIKEGIYLGKCYTTLENFILFLKNVYTTTQNYCLTLFYVACKILIFLYKRGREHNKPPISLNNFLYLDYPSFTLLYKQLFVFLFTFL